MKYTPGPWSIYPHDLYRWKNVAVQADNQPDFMVAEVFGHDADDGHGQANARLIAAAPELLGALEAIVALHGTHEKGLLRHECLKMANIARAAIAKATGQGEE